MVLDREHDPAYQLGMSELRELRQRLGLSQAALAKLAGTSQPQIKRLEAGDRELTVEWAKRLAPALGVPPEAVLFGRRERPTVQAVGYVGAGAQIIPVDDHEIGAGLEEVEIPPGIPVNAVLVIVKGDSMHPRYFDGEYLFYVRDARTPADLTGREVVLKLPDGRMFVKVLRRGSRPGLFNLESWNAPLLEDQPVEWAAPVMARVNRQY